MTFLENCKKKNKKKIKIKKATIYFELYSNYIVSSFGSVNSKNLIKIILIHEQNTFLRFLIMLHMKLFKKKNFPVCKTVQSIF